MGVREFSVSTQEFFDHCRTGNIEKAAQWVHNKTKKSKLNFLRSSTSNAGWLANYKDPTTGYNALHLAALNGHFLIVKLLVEHDEQLIPVKDRRGCLPMHLAAWNGHASIVQYLLEFDVGNIDIINNAKESPLHLAAQHGHGKVVAALLQKHANARLRNARFETPLDIAARTGKENVCELLISHCPELALQSAADCSRADNKTISHHVVYPLHVAARHGHIGCLKVLCESGFNVNYVTEEGTALHVAALFGQVEAVKLLLKYKVDVHVKDSQGKTVLEKLEDHENQKATDITQIIQSREGWAECRKLIESVLKTEMVHKPEALSEDKDMIWQTLPENSLAANGPSRSVHRAYTETAVNGNNNIYYPPSMTVEHVILDEDLIPSNHVSTLSLSSSNHHSELNTSMNESTGDNASACSVSPSIASTSSHSRIMPKFPVTSPNAKTRHANARRFGNPVLINGIEPKMISDPIASGHENQCTYQPPPTYETWQKKQSQESIIPGAQNHVYRNIPQPYDNAPLGGHRRWEHCCQDHSHFTCKDHGPNKGTVGNSVGRNVHQVIRENGTQTIPVKFAQNSRQRPTILSDLFTQPIPEHTEKTSAPPALLPRPNLKDSKSSDFGTMEKRTPSRTSNVTFASSTIERSASPDRNHPRHFNGKAPLALPEELGGSTCTSIISLSPERVLHPIDERLRRSVTTTSEDRTLVSMHEEFSPMEEQLKTPPLRQAKLSSSPAVVNSPESIVSSEHTADSSSSLPQISQISSSSISPSQTGISEFCDKSDSSNIVVPMRANRSRQRQASTSTTGTSSTTAQIDMDQMEEWRKIEEILNAIRRDSLFADSSNTNNSQVAVSVKNRKSQALTLQLNLPTSPNSVRQSAAFYYPSEPEDLKNAANRQRIDEKLPAGDIMEWLHLRVGLPIARSIEISAVLERNGFDMVKFMKSTLTKRLMTDMGIDKSIQHQILSYMDSQRDIPIPHVSEFEYASDWLSALHLIDYLGLFAKQKLTLAKSVQATALTTADLRRMGIDLIGHLERIQRSLNPHNDHMSLSSLTSSHHESSKSSSTINTESTPLRESTEDSIDNSVKWEEKTTLLLHNCASYTAHYLGSAEISNVEGAEDCRRAMNTLKSRIRQIAKVPQVLLEISVGGVNVLDSSTNRLTVQHEINRIQVVCQDELDLNCFAYIFQDNDKNFCHVYCVLTAEMARDIIMTLGHAFNLAYNLALGNAGS